MAKTKAKTKKPTNKEKKSGGKMEKRVASNGTPEIRGVDFIMYYVSDLPKSIEFYRDVLGLPLIGEPGESWAEFQAGNATIDIGTFDKDSIGQGAAVALAVSDVPEAVEYFRDRGIKVLQELYETPVCFGATIADPDGNKIHLHKRKDGTFGD